MATPVEEFQTAVGVGDVERARGLLSGHAEVRTAVNDPIAAFGSRPIAVAGKNLPVLDVLLEFRRRPLESNALSEIRKSVTRPCRP